MGFSGKPSKACEVCRARRTRCDEQRPQCGQCIRKHVPCKYRDLVDHVFRSENDIVFRKTNKNPQSFQSQHAEIAPSSRKKKSTVIRYIQPSLEALEVLGSNLFLSKCTWTIFNDYVPALYSREDCSLALRSSVEAVGLATLGLSRREASVLNAARQVQIVAMKEIQSLLNSPTTAGRADTLASIMLLATFAGLTCDPVTARAQWGKHIRGALAVLNAQTDDKDVDPIMDILRSHVTSNVLIDCQQRSLPPPKRLQEIRFKPRIPVSFQEKSEFVLDMLADLEYRDVSVATANKMIQDFDAVDRELGDLIRILPRLHPYMIAKPAICNVPAVHIYANHKSARVWNIIRSTKLKSYRLRFDKVKQIEQLADLSCLEGTIAVEEQLLNASSSAGAVIEDICASVPEFLRSMETATGTDPVSWAYSLLWPLSAARSSGHVPIHLTEYLRLQIQIIWDVSSFSVVDYHRKDLGVDVEPEAWTHVFFMC